MELVEGEWIQGAWPCRVLDDNGRPCGQPADCERLTVRTCKTHVGAREYSDGSLRMPGRWKRALTREVERRKPRAFDPLDFAYAMVTAELKQCPFCGPPSPNGRGPYVKRELREGYEDTPEDAYAWGYYVTCPCCACAGPWHKSATSAIRAWNTRPYLSRMEAAVRTPEETLAQLDVIAARAAAARNDVHDLVELVRTPAARVMSEGPVAAGLHMQLRMAQTRAERLQVKYLAALSILRTLMPARDAAEVEQVLWQAMMSPCSAAYAAIREDLEPGEPRCP